MPRSPKNNPGKKDKSRPANTNKGKGGSIPSTALEIAFLASLAVIGMALIYLLF